MNIFFAPPEQINESQIELTEQEAHHASRVLRYSEGENITVVDGRGGWYTGHITRINRNSVQIAVVEKREVALDAPRLALGMGIIKKRDRQEFAVEKAVELGASQIVLFQSQHTEKSKVRTNRLEMIALSAMKQSMRTWLPEIKVAGSLEECMDLFSGYQLLIAHEKLDGTVGVKKDYSDDQGLLLLVGPEGGFSEEEVVAAHNRGAERVSLGSHRLRAETAVVAMLSQFLR